MSYAFISYKREDEGRVARIARGLEKAGVKIWWDPELERGESWHLELEKRIGEAGCVVVVWSRGSVGAEGHFVRDEARRGMARNVLVPVTIDPKLQIPLGFGEVQAIDLSGWKGSPRDPYFVDLVAAVKAKLAGAPAPKPRGPKARLARRLYYGGTSSAFLSAVALFGFNAFGIAGKVCTAPGFQPELSDACGACRLGGRPTHEERQAWEGRPRGDCQALRAHINRFPEGAYRSEAAALLVARKVSYRDVWTPSERKLALYISAAPDTPEGKARALAEAGPAAERLCQGFGASSAFRFVSARAQAEAWTCATGSCSANGWAVCALQEHSQVEAETCEVRS